MSNRIEAGLLQAATLTGVGLFTGAVVAWGGLLLTEGQADDVAEFCARFFLTLAIVLPAILAVYNSANWRFGQEPQLYESRSDMAIMLLVAAIGGSLGGSLFYTLAVVYIPAIFSDLEPAAVQNAYFTLITPLDVGVVLATCLVTALLLDLFGRPPTST